MRVLRGELAAGEGLAPNDMGALARSVAQAFSTLARLDEREERRRLAPILRTTARAETELAKAQAEVARYKAREGASPEGVLKKLTVDELVALLARIRAEREQAKEASEKA